MYEILKSTLGLTNNEVLVLEKLYSYGVLTALELSDCTEIGKNTVLYVLKQLESKNLVQKRTRNNSFLFQARSPEVIMEMFEDKLRVLNEKRDDVKKLVTKFKESQNYDSLKKILYYDDEKSIKRLRASLIDAVQTGRMRRTLPNQHSVEVFENSDSVYVLNRKKLIAVRIQPAIDFEKILKLFKQVTDEK